MDSWNECKGQIIYLYEFPNAMSESLGIGPLKGYDICFVCPKGLELPDLCRTTCLREDFDESFFRSTEDYNALMLSSEFYKRFDRYEFMLVHQLDAFIFYDDLKKFCSMDYDYIGAPFFWGNEFQEVEGNRFTALVGNGGFSLRRIKPFCGLCEKYRDFIQKNIYKNEDVLFAYFGSLGELCIASEADALAFSCEMVDPEVVRDFHPGCPMGCHGWTGFYRERYLKKFRELNLDCSKIETLMVSKDRFDNEPVTLSVCMIVRNEEAVLENCLREVSQFADEIVIVDTGSTDRTKNIALQFTDKVYDFEWCDDFAAARNVSYSKASCEYIMWLDADDRISEADIHRIIDFKASVTMEPGSNGILFMADYERPENGGVFLYPRIVRRDANPAWEGRIHEHLVIRGLLEEQCQNACFCIRHEKKGEPDYQRNITIMDKVSKDELRNSFWLCAQFYLDCVLAGEKDKAEYYMKLAEDSTTSFVKRLDTYGLINRVLKFHRCNAEMLKWNGMYLRDKERYRNSSICEDTLSDRKGSGVKTISVCMIVRDEEDVLEDCLKRIKRFADELIIVDTGSKDRTKEIANSFTDKVYEYEWSDDFSKARNVSFAYATGDYVMPMEADRIIEEKEAQKLIELKKILGNYNTVCGIYDSPDNLGVPVTIHICMKRGDGRSWQGAVHERYEIKEPVLYSDIHIRHLDKKTKGERPEVKGRIYSNYAKKLSPEEFQKTFWLGIQCSVDSILAGENAEAQRLIDAAMEQNPPVEEFLRCCLLAGNNLLYWEYYTDALGMYELFITEMKKRRLINSLDSTSGLLMLLQKASKCAEKTGNINKAYEYNEMVLANFPDCLSAKLNRIRFNKDK